eukprot:TRINITY_DN10846_c0_g1_i2.p2 TRINITY_DN10846_c0_g1~~TRINITY_DN10846_c0_g1_i2.p2  ORF type:complete len:150 (-),score=9.62 TRINITY_DN10846_c0_g1_i2:29-478(-)
MKLYDWNDEKNEWLQRERSVAFEDIVFHLAQGGLLDTIEHPNQRQYPGQKIFIVNVEGYAYLVPFVEDDEMIFLKTIIPSRKMTKQYLGGEQNEADTGRKGTARFRGERGMAVSYTHLRAHETRHDLVCRLLLEKKKKNTLLTNKVLLL